MTEVKQRIGDLAFKDTELREELETKEEDKEIIFFPRIKPFYIPWFWPVF